LICSLVIWVLIFWDTKAADVSVPWQVHIAIILFLVVPLIREPKPKLAGEGASYLEPIITSPEKFAAKFNLLMPSAYRKVTAQDVKDMTECGLIGRYGHYTRQDLKTVRAILVYEQIREKRVDKQETKALDDVPRCKLCGELLSPQTEGKKGRPKEYCSGCELSRARERYGRWRS